MLEAASGGAEFILTIQYLEWWWFLLDEAAVQCVEEHLCLLVNLLNRILECVNPCPGKCFVLLKVPYFVATHVEVSDCAEKVGLIEVEIDAHRGEHREEGDVGFMFGAMWKFASAGGNLSVLDEVFGFIPVW